MKISVLNILLVLSLSACEKEPIISQPPFESKLIQWKFDADISQYENEIQANPVLFENWVIIALASINSSPNVPVLVAFNKNTGEKEWEYRHPEWTPDLLRNMKSKDHYMLLKFRDGIVCLDLHDQSILWQTYIQENISFLYPMEIFGDYLYLSEYFYNNINTLPFNDSVSLMRYHIITGMKEKLFGERIMDDHSPLIHPPVITTVDNAEIAIFTKAYLSSGPTKFVDMVAINTLTKEIVWKDSAYSHLQSAWNTPPYVYKNSVICASDYSLYSWDVKTGDMLWKTELTGLNQLVGFSFSGPFVHGDRVYAISNQGKVFCVDASNGQLIWQIIKVDNADGGPAKGPCNNPLIFKNYLLVNAWSERALIVFDINTGQEIERWSAAEYNGRNVIYDEETKTFFVTAYDKLRAFTINQ